MEWACEILIPAVAVMDPPHLRAVLEHTEWENHKEAAQRNLILRNLTWSRLPLTFDRKTRRLRTPINGEATTAWCYRLTADTSAADDQVRCACGQVAIGERFEGATSDGTPIVVLVCAEHLHTPCG